MHVARTPHRMDSGSKSISTHKTLPCSVVIATGNLGDSNEDREWGVGRVAGGAEEVEDEGAVREGGNIWNKVLP